MTKQRRRRDGQDSHDAITTVWVVVSSPYRYHEAPLIHCEWKDRVDRQTNSIDKDLTPHYILKTCLNSCGPTAVGAGGPFVPQYMDILRKRVQMKHKASTPNERV